jgi:hypothetical protein
VFALAGALVIAYNHLLYAIIGRTDVAEMDEISTLALDYLFGDHSVFKSDEELNAFVRQLDEKLRAVTAGPEGRGGRG